MTAVPTASNAFIGQHPISAGTKYGLVNDSAMCSGAHLQWDATFTGVFTFWTRNFPELAAGALLTESTAGLWIQQNPSSGYAAISPAGAATFGTTPLTITVAGGTAGGAFVDLGNLSAQYLACQVVCTVIGFARIKGNGKY